MLAEPFVFSRTIPPTVPSTVQQSESVPVSSISTISNSSVATSLSSQLSNLIDTANYLQSVIQSLNQNISIPVSVSANPELGQALSTIYNGKIPAAISMVMYGNTLAAELGCSQVNLAAGPDSTVEANPLQYQALLTINKNVESNLATSETPLVQSGLLLRGLASDVIANTNLQTALSTYPATQNSIPSQPNPNVISASSVDISPDVASIVQSNINQTGQVYSSMYQMLTKPDPIASDTGNVVAALSTFAIPDLIRMSSMLKAVSSGSLANSSLETSSGVSALVFPQMMTHSSSLLFSTDQIMQMAVGPASQMNNSIGTAMGMQLQALKSIGSLVGVIRSMSQEPTVQSTGPLAGMPLNNYATSGLPISSAVPTQLSGLGFSPGINEISSLMQFAIHNITKESALHSDSFQRLTARRLSDTSTLTKILAVSSSIYSLVSITNAFIKAQQGSTMIASLNPTTQLAMVSNILANSTTGNGASYIVQNGSVSLVSPSIPPVTTGASELFSKSGVSTSLSGLKA